MTNYDLYSEFDIDKHAETFIDYLEVCISPQGKVYYATPSHTQFLENVLKQQCIDNNVDYQQYLDDAFNRHFDWMEELCTTTGYCSVWNDYLIKSRNGLTKAQADVLFALRTKHYKLIPHLALYRGNL